MKKEWLLISYDCQNNIQNSKNEKVNHLNEAGQVMKIFDHIIESSKVGLRKPDPKIYYMYCQTEDKSKCLNGL